MSAQGQTRAPDVAAIEALARDAMARLPEGFARHLDGVVLQVAEFADDDVLDEMGIDSPYDLLGLYTGRPVGQKSVSDIAPLPDMIHLYRRPLLEEWVETGESLEALVTHVLIHEVGHHFGLSDADMEAIERGMA
jgi:predicted Zn-dependent protease with MMP-like domain